MIIKDWQSEKYSSKIFTIIILLIAYSNNSVNPESDFHN